MDNWQKRPWFQWSVEVLHCHTAPGYKGGLGTLWLVAESRISDAHVCWCLRAVRLRRLRCRSSNGREYVNCSCLHVILANLCSEKAPPYFCVQRARRNHRVHHEKLEKMHVAFMYWSCTPKSCSPPAKSSAEMIQLFNIACSGQNWCVREKKMFALLFRVAIHAESCKCFTLRAQKYGRAVNGHLWQASNFVLSTACKKVRLQWHVFLLFVFVVLCITIIVESNSRISLYVALCLQSFKRCNWATSTNQFHLRLYMWRVWETQASRSGPSSQRCQCK